jgi:rSAM-partnered protein
MVERAERYRVGDQPRGVDEPEWEVFVREDERESLRHVGSVSAPSADVAHEQATKLFAWCTSDVWVCPAGAVRRYSTHTLDGDAEPAPVDTDGTGDPHTDGR